MTAPEEVRRPPDLRLVPAALAAWAVVLLGLGLGPAAGAVATTLAFGAAVWAGRAARDRAGGGRRRGTHTGGRSRSGWLAAAGCAAAAGLVVTAHGALVVQHPLRAAAEAGSAATVRVVLGDDPHPIRSAAAGEEARVLVDAVLERAEARDGGWVTGGRMLLIAPADGWAGLLPGQAVTADGLLAPAGRSDLTVAALRVRGPPREVAAPPWWQIAAGELRTGLRHAATVLPEAPAGLLPGLAVGDTGAMTSEVEDDFRAAGLSHLTAVSGDNLIRDMSS